MPEESKESKAKKLAAARKKLKEYQKRGGADATHTDSETPPASAGSVSSNLSEKSDSELHLNGHDEATNDAHEAVALTLPEQLENVEPALNEHNLNVVHTIEQQQSHAMPTAADYFNNTTPASTTFDTLFTASATPPPPAEPAKVDTTQQSLNAIQVLITEKAQLNAEVNRYRTACREKDFELEELRTLHTTTTQRFDELQQRYVAQQQATEKLRHNNAELQHKLAQARAQNEDETAHVNELKQQLSVLQTRDGALEQQFKDKCNELEMAELRIRQLSDTAANLSKDNRVETLTQTQFMYEQQIRDLQAMVQQLTQDKEQANAQYQNYVQHLNSELTNVNEKYAALTDECAKLQENEGQLVEHISGLEREIQRNISRQQDQLKQSQEQDTNTPALSTLQNDNEKLREQISDFELERHEFQLKIKSQEDRLETLNKTLLERQRELSELHAHLEHVNAEQPDKVKLLATMESDKVAASRALTQNVELKQQLDELEMRFVQLTNDKAELMNKLDAEEYANREMRANYVDLEQRLQSIDERFKFKDEEMIRLSHENVELAQKNASLLEQLTHWKNYELKQGETDELAPRAENEHDEHNCEHASSEKQENIENCLEAKEVQVVHEHEHKHDDHEHHHYENRHDHHHDQHDHQHEHHDHPHEQHDHHQHHKQREIHETPHYIPTTEAVERLQQRFTQLMSQVAELTDEKQRLEHLVLQLQSETETIGEYITLYQTQRRILKQREYEKAAQMQLLQNEREQMRTKITLLNNLVSRLGVELPHNADLQTHLSAALAESVSIEPTTESAATADVQQSKEQQAADIAPLNNAETQQILTKIQNIISEIKENTKEVPTVTHTVDHLNCCLGKFEVV